MKVKRVRTILKKNIPLLNHDKFFISYIFLILRIHKTSYKSLQAQFPTIVWTRRAIYQL